MPKTVGMEPVPPTGAHHAPIRVLIADDDALVLEALTTLIAGEPDLEVVAVAGDARHAAELAARHHPDVALIDVRMDGGGPWAARSIRRRSPRSEILAFSAHDDRGYVLDMIAAGATGYLLKGASSDDVLDAVRRTAAGRAALSVGITADVVAELVARLGIERARQEGQRRAAERVRRALTPDG